jgi:hypothetical protein
MPARIRAIARVVRSSVANFGSLRQWAEIAAAVGISVLCGFAVSGLVFCFFS